MTSCLQIEGFNMTSCAHWRDLPSHPVPTRSEEKSPGRVSSPFAPSILYFCAIASIDFGSQSLRLVKRSSRGSFPGLAPPRGDGRVLFLPFSKTCCCGVSVPPLQARDYSEGGGGGGEVDGRRIAQEHPANKRIKGARHAAAVMPMKNFSF